MTTGSVLMEMRIDELARRAGVPTRTIRYYTQQDLLPPPRLRGRVGYYSETHLDRLRLIKELQEKRFLPLTVIKNVVRKWEEGTDLEAMLAPLDLLFAPAWDAGNGSYTRTQLAKEARASRSVIDAAEDAGLLFPKGSGRNRRYTQDDVQMVEIVKELDELGLPLDLARLYRDGLEEISRRQVRAFNDCIVQPIAKRDLPPDELRDELLGGYRRMGRAFNRLLSLLHRKLLQQAVESAAASDQDPARDQDRADDQD